MTTHTPISEEELDSYQAWAITFTPDGTCEIVTRLIAEVRRLNKIINSVCYRDPNAPGFSESANDAARKIVEQAKIISEKDSMIAEQVLKIAAST